MTYDPNDAKSIFLQAAELPTSGERAAFLEKTCAGKPELKARVESLLKTALDPDSLLDQPVAEFGATQMVPQDTSPVSLGFLKTSNAAGSLGRLGGYEILEVIGRGGMGVVLRAMDSKLNRVVAIKVLAPELASQPQARKRFLREAQAAAAVSHDHVVTIHAVDDDEKVPLLVMECIVGQSLQQKIDKVGALGLKEILRIGTQIASGLAAAHKQGLVHRDIKPANILLENGVERVKITDFGLARATDDVGITQSGQIAGTPQYMSPEQAMGHAVDQRSDLFSLGSVLYTMCTGRPAFRADSAVAVLRRVCDDTPRPINEVNAEVPDWLIAIVNRLMSKKPEDRFQSAKEVASLLEQWLAHTQQPETVAKPELASATTSSERTNAQPRGILARAWDEWWSERDRWITISVQTVLILVYLFCMVCFVSFGLSTGHDSDGRVTFTYRLGVPSPWFKFEVYPEPLVPFRTGLHLWSSSVLIGLVGCAAYYVFWRIEKARDPKTSKWNGPAFMLGIWGVGALFAVGLGHWQGYAALNKPRVAVASPTTPVATADAPGTLVLPTPDGKPFDPWKEAAKIGVAAPPPAIAPFDAEQAKKHQEAWAKHLGVPVEYTNSLGMKFRLIPPGEFLMGSPPEQLEESLKERGEEPPDMPGLLDIYKSVAPQHRVILTQPIYLGMHEVTQHQFEQVLGRNPSAFSATGQYKELVAGIDTQQFPAETVSWNDAAEFCAKLSERERLTPFDVQSRDAAQLKGTGYRLPTEAEWESACRAGTTTKFWVGDNDRDLSQTDWLQANSGRRPHPVGELRANPFGLFDVHGNAQELVLDWWEPNYYSQFESSPAIDPLGPVTPGKSRVSRGGRFAADARAAHSSKRGLMRPTSVLAFTGFRVALSVDAVRTAMQQQTRRQPPAAVTPFDAMQAKAHQEACAKQLNEPVEYTNSIGMKLRLVPAGEFMMGSSAEEVDRLLADFPDVNGDQWLSELVRDEAPARQVTIRSPFYLGAHEVTIGQFREFVTTTKYQTTAEKSGGGLTWNLKENKWDQRPENIWSSALHAVSDAHPVGFLTLTDARAFCEWLSAKENRRYFVPTDEQWEFACRAGSASRWYFGDDPVAMKQHGWTLPHSLGNYHAVGRLAANPFGLFDLYGNASELTVDAHDRAVERGGSPSLSAQRSRSANRWVIDKPHETVNGRGLRVALAVAKANPPPIAVAPFDAAQAKSHQEAWAKHLKLEVERTNVLGMKLRLIPPGKFQMGSTSEELAQLKQELEQSGASDFDKFVAQSSGPRHVVELSQPFYMGQHEVTVAQFRQFVEETSYQPSAERAGNAKFTWKSFVFEADATKLPVCGVSWEDANAFCQWLTAKSSADQNKLTYDLPTEAQWEFACRAGSQSLWSSGDDAATLSEHAIVGQKGTLHPAAVGLRRANAFGLFDMHGNVDEWCLDWHNHGFYGRSPLVDPAYLDAPKDAASGRVARGGAWNADAWWARSATRTYDFPTSPTFAKGFRVVGKMSP